MTLERIVSELFLHVNEFSENDIKSKSKLGMFPENVCTDHELKPHRKIIVFK